MKLAYFAENFLQNGIFRFYASFLQDRNLFKMEIILSTLQFRFGQVLLYLVFLSGTVL